MAESRSLTLRASWMRDTWASLALSSTTVDALSIIDASRLVNVRWDQHGEGRRAGPATPGCAGAGRRGLLPLLSRRAARRRPGPGAGPGLLRPGRSRPPADPVHPGRRPLRRGVRVRAGRAPGQEPAHREPPPQGPGRGRPG